MKQAVSLLIQYVVDALGSLSVSLSLTQSMSVNFTALHGMQTRSSGENSVCQTREL